MIFIDAGPLIARYVVQDQFHQAAELAWGELTRAGERMLTSNFVLGEMVSFLITRAGAQFAAERGQRLLESGAVEVHHVGPDDEAQALLLLARQPDRTVSFTDCVSFALMRRRRLDRVFTFDQHFAAAGFQIWP